MIAMGLKQRLEQKFDEEIRFFKGWQRDKKGVGALLPTSSITARRMASVIEVSSGLPVLELGAGTGVITKAILERGVLPRNLVSLEYASHFYDLLRRRFPEVDIRNGDVFELDTVLGERRHQTFDCVISAVPMLSFPLERRVALMKDLLSRIPHGRPVVQITHGPMSPLPAMPELYTISHFDFVVRNLPPAQLWIYRSA
jgi:phosphatidylethanolamine/phosphatidyl-N-methylethanolamine N-methyltransferase